MIKKNISKKIEASAMILAIVIMSSLLLISFSISYLVLVSTSKEVGFSQKMKMKYAINAGIERFHYDFNSIDSCSSDIFSGEISEGLSYSVYCLDDVFYSAGKYKNKEIVNIIELSDIEKSKLQMRDLGILSNLKLWVHSDRVQKRYFNDNFYVPLAYDVSLNNNHAVNSSEVEQPLLGGFNTLVFNGGQRLDLGESFSSDVLNGVPALSISFWSSISEEKTENLISGAGISGTLNGYWASWNNRRIRIIARSFGGEHYKELLSRDLNLNTLYHFLFQIDYANDEMRIYINGDFEAGLTGVGFTNRSWTQGSPGQTRIGMSPFILEERYLKGEIDDFRIFNKILLPSEILAIYNQTKHRYAY